MKRYDMIAFDADDTLWHNEHLYDQTQAGLVDLLGRYGIGKAAIDNTLYQIEGQNIKLYGYGIKSFALSMIEAAVELSGGRIAGQDVLGILNLAKAQLNAPVELLEHVADTVSRLATRHPLMIITKGDLLDQENKLARSGLGEYFKDIEVVSDKTRESYARLFKNHGLDARRIVMVGNSLRSDILPVLELGASTVYVPYPNTWLHEAADVPATGTPGFYELENLGQLPGLIQQLETKTDGDHPSV
jgi:putative hydrolase of the HAD superfamily